jgi:hypothetical protein
VVAGFRRVALRGEGEAAVLPVRFARERLLGATNVGTGCVNFIVACSSVSDGRMCGVSGVAGHALLLEVVKALFVILELCDASAFLFVLLWSQ